MKKLLNVTDLSAYLYCPRKFFLERVKGIRAPVSKVMIEGSLRHQAMEVFSKNEQVLVEAFEHFKEQKEIVISYLSALSQIIKEIFNQKQEIIKKFYINQQHLRENIMAGMNNDFILRAESILSGMKKGFFGKKLWENLELKYISEMPVESENLGLKGKIDRVMISKEKIVPFELKTRAAEKVYDSDEIQVTAYAMLLEEHFNQPISFGILESGNTKHEILIKPESRQKVLNLIKEINELKNPKYPQNFSKCQNCQLKEACENLVT